MLVCKTEGMSPVQVTVLADTGATTQYSVGSVQYERLAIRTIKIVGDKDSNL